MPTTSRKLSKLNHPAWWTALLIAVLVAFVLTCAALFAGTFASYVSVTLTAERSGLVMESGAKVKLRGVQVGRVGGITSGADGAALRLEIDPHEIRYIPANVEAQIRSTTAFGAKYVDLIYPPHPTTRRLSAGEVLHSRNVSTEVNTVFQNLVDVLHKLTIAPARILGLGVGRLAAGAPADLVIFDPGAKGRIETDKFRSKSKNAPFDGRPVQGRVERTIVDGRTIFERTA